jgi:pantetheine-phosphate adenylyltransferase
MRRALYPGTFDPVTNGHLDILHRAAHLFDEVVMAVAPNTHKQPLFTLEERIRFIEENLRQSNVRVTTFEGLVVDFARREGAIALIRGMRAVSDFEFEFQMTQMNRELDGEVETIFLMPSARYFYTSSSLMKQVARFEIDRIAKFLPPNVVAALRERFHR